MTVNDIEVCHFPIHFSAEWLISFFFFLGQVDISYAELPRKISIPDFDPMQLDEKRDATLWKNEPCHACTVRQRTITHHSHDHDHHDQPSLLQ